MFPYQDKNISIDERVEDLLSRMTTWEKIMQTDQYSFSDFTQQNDDAVVTDVNIEKLHNLLNGHSVGSVQLRGMTAVQANIVQHYAVEKTRLGIPFLFSEEALHGLLAGRATSFPQQIGLAASFNPELGKQMGHAIATETRAAGIHETYSPVMDLIRDPRYGRGEESYGEDIYLCSEFAREVVLGMQGTALTAPDAIAAEPKHYVGYGSPVGGLNCAPSTMGRHDVFSDCLPVFEAAFVEGGAVNTMCSYNSIDSIPVSMDREILTDVLRGQYGMPGFVRSDMTAVVRLYDWHFVAETREEAIRMGLEAGVDLQLYDFPHDEWQNSILNLINSGKMKEETLNEACRRVLRVKFMLGLFETPYTDECREEKYMHCQKHQELASDIAKQSICLLKNENNILPLSKNLKTIAVLGPGANEVILGDYSEYRGRKGCVSVLDGINSIVSENTTVLHERGCNFLGEAIHPFHPGMLQTENGEPGLTANYYNGSLPQGDAVVSCTDHMINFNWIYSNPHPELDASCFSVAWTGYVCMPNSFDGCIGLSSQDSMRLYIDNKLIIDGWGDGKSADQMIDFSFEAGKKYAVRIEFNNDRRGARIIFGYNTGREDFSKAVDAAQKADVAIVCVGDNEETSGENFDRVSLNLPGTQLDFVKAIYKTGTPVVLVMQSGRPVTAVWEEEHVPAILQAWFPGEKGGHAVAQTLFGDNSPSGRLPITFPKSVGQIPCHYSRRPGGGKRYIEMNWLPLYPFGFGLSYTNFAFSNLRLSGKEIKSGESLKATINVKNTGNCSGIAVPQLYLRDMVSSVVKPEKELAAFCRVELKAGESKDVELEIKPKSMRTLGADYIWRIEAGEFRVFIGDNAENVIMEDSFVVKN